MNISENKKSTLSKDKKFLVPMTYKKIIIAEKPSVAKEYAKALKVSGTQDGYIENDEWIVTWTIGHLIAMSYPEKYDKALKKWSLEPLPFIPTRYLYEPIRGVIKQFQIVKKLYNRSDISEIYYAGDSGREGLYIQCLVRQEAGHNPNAIEKVVWIDSQTEEEILKGIREAKPLSAYDNLKDSGYLRAIEDYLSGINFSRILSLQYAYMICKAAGIEYTPIAVGRVMTCVLGMIVDRERDIRNYKPTPFYKIAGLITSNNSIIESEWRAVKGSRFFENEKLYADNGFKNEEDANNFINTLSKKFKVEKVEITKERKMAPNLFNLAELQGECSKKLHISPSNTLKIVQSLYEKKLTTYPRTDARVLTNAIAKEISKNVRGLANGEYSKYANYVLDNGSIIPKKYIDDSKVTDHYAIIPTGVIPEELSSIEKTVYDMIVKRFLSIFYPAAVFEKVQVEFNDSGEKFFSTGKYLAEEGFYQIAGREKSEEKENLVRALASLKEGETYTSDYQIKKGETAPPKRYTTGSIILAMENAGKFIEDEELREQIKSSGIGTSATRAEVVEKLQKLGYVKANKKTQAMYSTNFGEMIYEVVKMSVPSLLSPEMTASWEKGLTYVAEGTTSAADYNKLMTNYIIKECSKMKENRQLEKVATLIKPFATNNFSIEDADPKEFEPEITNQKCPYCDGNIMTTRYGFACENYDKDSDSGCKFSIGEICGVHLDIDDLALLLETGKTGFIDSFVSKKGKQFTARLVWSKDDNSLQFDFPDNNLALENNSKVITKCPNCGAAMIKTAWEYKCEAGCNVKLSTVICKKHIPLYELERIFTKKKSGTISGFKGNSEKTFSAKIIWNGEDKYEFEFVSKKRRGH